jgi:hypothetical protein
MRGRGKIEKRISKNNNNVMIRMSMRIQEPPQWVMAVAVLVAVTVVVVVVAMTVVVVVVAVTKAVISDSLAPEISRLTSTKRATKVNKTHFVLVSKASDITNRFLFR